jgi:ankyrin repeat protein
VSAELGSLEVAKFIVERQEMSYGEAEFKYIVTLNRTITKLLHVHNKVKNAPLHLSAAAGNTSTVGYGSDLRSCNTRGEYPLTLAARFVRNDTVNLSLQSCCAVKCEGIMTSALSHVHDDTVTEVSGGENEKPIHVASRMGHKEIVSLLLQFGASLASRTDSGNTALHLASEAGHLSLVKYLLELQRDGLCSLNCEDKTPLHLAVRNGRDYFVTYFSKSGCNVKSASTNCATCLHVACENGYYTTAECLLKHGAEINLVNSW